MTFRFDFFTTIYYFTKQPDLIGRAVIRPQDFMFCVSTGAFQFLRQEFEISMLVQINELWTGCVTLWWVRVLW